MIFPAAAIREAVRRYKKATPSPLDLGAPIFVGFDPAGDRDVVVYAQRDSAGRIQLRTVEL